jgi:probable rRNA maturation factor
MAIELEIQQETASPDGIEDALKAAAVAVLENQRVPSAMITILLTDDDSMRALNRQFRSEDKSTDVLSFSFGDEPPSLGSDLPYLGDIAISVPFAHRQAEARGHSTTAELQLLTIHGILHLLGYDHGTETEKWKMWRVQRNVLDQLDLAHVEPTESS